jgi:DNA-binding CsgD family transcriptional regulator
MQVWNISPSAAPSLGSRGASVPALASRGGDAVSGLVDCIARDDFGLRALGRLNQAMPVAWWSVYKVYSDQPPELCTLGQFGVPDIALECFRVYRAGPYRHDTAFLQARDQARSASAGHAVLAHCVADDFGAVHREQIYQRHSLSERLSVVSREPADAGRGDGGLLAINLYRHRAQAHFSAAEIDAVFELASPLMAVVRRHLELRPGDPGTRALAGEGAPPTSIRRLEQLCPALTDRELQVCERMLRGWTFEGIAADLRLSVATVKTYRNRAFERLGIHFRNQLFSLVLGGADS